ncbi:MAG: T9SS type A sorting domain-containing protein [candidate division Zixibacteria bacterium]|nr:T9SS type A sorting domain-containing protein [candidate division Zixibacteria bacterium]
MKKVVVIAIVGAAFLYTSLIYANPVIGPMITEFSTDPDWFEISSDSYFDLHWDECKLVYGNDTLTFEEGTVIDSGVYLIFNTDDFPELDFPEEGGLIEWIWWEIPVQEIHYGNAGVAPAPVMNTSTGQDYFSAHVSEDLTMYFTPSPGYPNVYRRPRPGYPSVVINEVNVGATWQNGNFIELIDLMDSPVDISGWRIVGNSVYTIPHGTEVTYLYTLRENDAPEFFEFNAGCDNLYLFTEYGILVDQVGWSTNHGENVSFMRFPDGDFWVDDGWDDNSSSDFENGFPTKNSMNRHESPGFVVLGAEAYQEGYSVVLKWTDPLWDEEFVETYLVRDTLSIPRGIDDGETIYHGTTEEFVDFDVEDNTIYYYTAFAKDSYGNFGIPLYESSVSIRIEMSDVDPDPELPAQTTLWQNFPNPFNAQTTISYTLENNTNVELGVYDILGRKVAELVNGNRTPGKHIVSFEGSQYSSGIYFYRLLTDGENFTRKMVLLK